MTLPRTLYAASPTARARAEAVCAIDELAARCEGEWLSRRRAECAAMGRELEELRRDVVDLRQECALGVLAVLQKYSPDQRRVPKGNPHGGEWTTEAPVSTPVDDGSPSSKDDSEVASDVTPDNTWIPGAQYAAGWEHHFVPWATFEEYSLQPATRQVFIDATSGPLADITANRWSPEHRAYNEAVDAAFKSFLERNNIAIDETDQLTPAQAEEFVDEVFHSSDPRIRNFNMRIWREAFRYWRRSGGRGAGGDEE